MVNYAVNVGGGNADGVNSGIFVGTQNMVAPQGSVEQGGG
jgi:hypothetical protein